MKPRLVDQLLSIARAKVESSVSRYGRGVRWEKEGLNVHGSRWVSMYLPVWLYSYQQPNDSGGLPLRLIGPAGAAGLYWALYRYYRNPDKSHAFERESKVDAKPVTG